ncbi:MAG: 50S ribosomal protein L13 [Candidatus Omnitrophica bacterium]|nr:50S ribosomal protein L13 [Candidatus Omnitrophota bacterium]
MIKKTKTFIAKPTEIERVCYLVDAKNKVLGRLASRVASILRGKHKPVYTPHVDTGDMVIIINAEKVRITGTKLQKKTYQRYSGYPSGQKTVVMKDMMQRKPTFVLKHAITGMLPKGALGTQMGRKLKIYAGDKHEHGAQKPIVLEV